MENYVVTIARGFGSGGKAIAMGLAEQLGIECYEHRLLALASENTGLDEDMLLIWHMPFQAFSTKKGAAYNTKLYATPLSPFSNG